MIDVVIAPDRSPPISQRQQARKNVKPWRDKVSVFPTFARHSVIQVRQDYCLFSNAVRVHNLMMRESPSPKGSLKLE